MGDKSGITNNTEDISTTFIGLGASSENGSTDSILKQRKKDSSSSFSENDVEVHKICNNYRFGFKKWKSHVTQRPLHNRSQTVQNLYDDVNKIKLERADNSIVCNILYVILFGWWQSLVYFLLGILMFITVIGRHYGLFCFKMSRYYLWPFGKFVYIVSTDEIIVHVYQNHISLGNSSHGENTPLVQKPHVKENCSQFWSKVQSYVWLLLCVHILVVIHTVVMVITWLMVISIPIAKMNLKSITRLIFLPPESVRVDNVQDYVEIIQKGEMIMFIPKSVNIYYYKYNVDGMNIILVNLLVFVILTIVFGYLETISAPVKCILGALSIIPLSYYIGMAITSISAQTSVALGAIINATFGAIVEMIIFVIALNKGKEANNQECFTEIVKATLTVSFENEELPEEVINVAFALNCILSIVPLKTISILGTIIGCTLLIPGLCMIVGGIKYTSQRFNPKSANVSCLLMFVAIGGIFAPTIFSGVLGDMQCEQCQNIYLTNSTLLNRTYGLNCEQCTNSIFGVEGDTTLYDKHIKPMVYAVSIMLPIAYIIGLVFTLKTHTVHLTKDFMAQQLDLDNTHHHGHSHGSPQWGKVKSVVILLLASGLIGVCADIITENIQQFLMSTGISTYFTSVAFLSIIPALPEVVNGLQFALQNNINLAIEIGTSIAIQVCTIEVPLLVLIDAIYPFELYMVFNEVHLWAVFFAVIVINYTFQDGKSDYFQGAVLLFIYLILLCMYFFMPNPGTCVI